MMEPINEYDLTLGQEEFVRDVCSVVPKSKSEVCRRLTEIITQIREKDREDLISMMELAASAFKAMSGRRGR